MSKIVGPIQRIDDPQMFGVHVARQVFLAQQLMAWISGSQEFADRFFTLQIRIADQIVALSTSGRLIANFDSVGRENNASKYRHRFGQPRQQILVQSSVHILTMMAFRFAWLQRLIGSTR